MGDSGSYGGAPDPGSAREEAERLVAAALAMARSAASEARDRAGAFGPLGQVISDVLDQTGVVPRPGRPGGATPGTPPTEGPGPTPADPPRKARPHGAVPEPGPAAATPPADDTPPPNAEAPPPTGTPSTVPAQPPTGEAPPTDTTSRWTGEVPPQAGRAGVGAAFGAGFATGDPECCVCPVCRSIAALRDPSPELAERLATGAGDFAAGVASLLRALSSVTAPAERRTGPGGGTTGSGTGDDPTGDTWAAATRASTADPDVSPGSGGAGQGSTAPSEPDVSSGSGGGGQGSTAPVDPAGAPSADVPGPRGDTVWREATGTRHDSWPAGEPDDVWAAAIRAEAGTGETRTTAGPDRATPAGAEQARPAAPPATGRPPVPASRTPEGPVAAGSGEQTAPGEDG
ncbi:hypothetical protein C6361_34865 [Plantactinospora sp. BC1]|uniref:hypothetical protein n=1 Tax=Plantactinospora sp. BC1 TaxID=2108470 RepID=UPI000D157BE2|nr:hypothetical protein C6361_34865 [Plantactinospora sp. BC1]